MHIIQVGSQYFSRDLESAANAVGDGDDGVALCDIA